MTTTRPTRAQPAAQPFWSPLHENPLARLRARQPGQRAGLRAVVWFQGCTLRCPGCFNPATHDPVGGCESDTESLAEEILGLRSRIEGVSISGGEPFEQPEPLLDLLERVGRSPLSRLVFTGYTLAEITDLDLGPAILRHVDVLVAGRYVVAQRAGSGLLGSANQQIRLLTRRYALADLGDVPAAELILHADGTFTATGINPWQPGARSRRVAH